jgi:hypothetical protein
MVMVMVVVPPAPPMMMMVMVVFCHITQTWRGKPLVSCLAVVELIAATTTKTGLTVRCELDENSYPKAIRVTDAEMASLNIETDDWHPEWNCTIRPRQSG